MKKILIFLLLFLNISCGSNSFTKKSIELIDCPIVFFASDHRNYLYSEEKPLALDNLSFKAAIDNYAFNNSCFQNDNILTFPLDILFIIDPIKPTSSKIHLPFYVALLNSDQKLLEIQYFSLSGEIKNNLSTEIFYETELSNSINIITSSNSSVSTLVIGFMLDKKKEELLN